jgi:hypothetical protein
MQARSAEYGNACLDAGTLGPGAKRGTGHVQIAQNDRQSLGKSRALGRGCGQPVPLPRTVHNGGEAACAST